MVCPGATRHGPTTKRTPGRPRGGWRRAHLLGPAHICSAPLGWVICADRCVLEGGGASVLRSWGGVVGPQDHRRVGVLNFWPHERKNHAGATPGAPPKPWCGRTAVVNAGLLRTTRSRPIQNNIKRGDSPLPPLPFIPGLPTSGVTARPAGAWYPPPAAGYLPLRALATHPSSRRLAGCIE